MVPPSANVGFGGAQVLAPRVTSGAGIHFGHRYRIARVKLLALGLLWATVVAPTLSRAADLDPAAALNAALQTAEASLRAGEPELAESHYRAALLEGWLLLGATRLADGRLDDARDALLEADGVAFDTQRATLALAQVELRRGAPEAAVRLASLALARQPDDLEARRLLVQARVANGQPEVAVQELEEAHARAPEEPELAYLLATGYLRLGQPQRAEPLFARVLAQRPLAATHVLLGRAYRDAGEYDRARQALRAALRQDPRARRAHYYLGMVAVLEEGVAKLDEAIREFRAELALAPDDALVALRLGMALVEAQQPTQALPHLERATREADASSEAWLYLGRCLAALDRSDAARPALERALSLARRQRANDVQLGSVHYQLALALRKLGDATGAAPHFAEAARLSAARAENARERLASYLAGQESTTGTFDLPGDGGSDTARTAGADLALFEAGVLHMLARAYFNLGIIQAQAERFTRAAQLLGRAAALAPDFPNVQYSLGVAHFNAGQFEQALEPLTRANTAAAPTADASRLLALTHFNLEQYAAAAELLRDDARRAHDVALQYAYGLALVRSGKAEQAEREFSLLIARHAGTPELQVVLGQAHAQQGDFPAAVAALQEALRLRPTVPEANGALGFIYLRQGQWPAAEQALRAELDVRPGDARTQHLLATVLDLQGRSDEALPLLEAALRAKPAFADARYLLGKLLLARGQAAEAVEQLVTAARLAPDDANIHYQLALAYRAAGRAQESEEQFVLFRALKDKARAVAP
jgi:tetratricopeptide (TPR) repeat protein